PEREEHVKQMAADYGAQGVIHYGLQFCQPYQMESLPLEKKLESQDLPVLRIETDYSMEDVEQLKTRVEAFLEMLA
ncbi:MAG: 2-hydroxyacyl-CoA dehydratase family protein, partial [Desulfarculaceae bacterium]|nr:2-hydroxyacyl-CoA dehydratase family protein [Desulfarculaceae bacterium]